ncbi:Hypothetical predicted protein [Mytilus galloprovincialis]|uniref:TRPM-like domain-containing protein n=1 Tax=Mytilus galloprovincialis TaxID=29158 RepID=A0A8B6F3I6_MYTGA|nr:Hypothetical predicted protein [Mytilus galloprovincialis]
MEREKTGDAKTSEDKSKTYSNVEYVNDTDLLILTILMNRKDCILQLLQEKEQHIIYAALFASALLKSLSKLAESEEQLELGTAYLENSR